MSSVQFTLAESNLRGLAVTSSGRWIKSAQLATAILLLPQISTALWWAQTHSWIQLRGFVNVEYLVLFALALLFPGWITISALSVELTIALLEPLAHLYYFSPGDAIRSLRYLSFIPPHRIIAYSLLLLLYVTGCTLFLRLTLTGLPGLGSRRMAGLLAAVALCAWGYDLSTGHLPQLHASVKGVDADLRTVRVVRAPAASLAGAMFVFYKHVPGHHRPMPSALGQAIAGLQPGTQPNIVLVLTESWGLAFDQQINRAETAPYFRRDLAEKYEVKTGTVKFYGSTTSGETRELCGDAAGRWGDAHSPGQYQSCWPAELDRTGYQSLAVHGFAPTMYGRETWYPELGFSEQAFLPLLQRDGARICGGAFPGACDPDVAKWIGNRLEDETSRRPMFIHWVTLNSHLPVSGVQTPVENDNCRSAGIDDHGSFCAWFNRVLDVQRSVAELAMKPGLRPTVFVIVGDHAPPFLRPEARAKFSQVAVPWVVLTPRSMPEANIQLHRASLTNARPEPRM